MATHKANSQPRPFYTDGDISIDAYAGPWSSTDEFETWWSSEEGQWSSNPIPNGVVIRVIDDDGNITIYKRSAGVWTPIGGGSTYSDGDGIVIDNNQIGVDFADDNFVDELMEDLGEEETTPTSSEDGTLHYAYPYDGSSLENPSGVLVVNLVNIDTTNNTASIVIYNTASGTIISGDIVATLIKRTDDAGETTLDMAMKGDGTGAVTCGITYTGDITNLALLLEINTNYQYSVLTTAQKYISIIAPSS